MPITKPKIAFSLGLVLLSAAAAALVIAICLTGRTRSDASRPAILFWRLAACSVSEVVLLTDPPRFPFLPLGGGAAVSPPGGWAASDTSVLASCERAAAIWLRMPLWLFSLTWMT